MSKPTRDHNFYLGIDPGFKGALGLVNQAGTTVRVWDMPITRKQTDRQREIDLVNLKSLLQRLQRLPDVCVGLEWPTTRPGEGAERSERFGRGKGILEAMLFCLGFEYHKLAPHLWKGRLGLPGKSDPAASKAAADTYELFYPEWGSLIRGPKGGFKDGRCEAVLIAHFLRTGSVGVSRRVVERFGRDSVEAQAFMLQCGPGRKSKKLFR